MYNIILFYLKTFDILKNFINAYNLFKFSRQTLTQNIITIVDVDY